MNRSPRSATMAAVVMMACAGVQSESDTGPEGGRLITASEIAESGAKNAWDAIRLNVPHIRMGESSQLLRPTAIQSQRGRSSLMLDDSPLVIIDEVRIQDLARLKEIPVADIARIRVLSGAEGTTYYGTNAVNGVIVIETRS